MAPDEICRRLGEAKFKEIFLSLNAQSMKKALEEAGLAAVRLPSHSSTRKRNEDWCARLWRAVSAGKPCTLVLYGWLGQQRSAMLSAFLDSIGVAHDKGLTEADFIKDTSTEKLVEAGQNLLQNPAFDPREVAAYLLFLDVESRSDKFAGLRAELERHLPKAA